MLKAAVDGGAEAARFRLVEAIVTEGVGDIVGPIVGNGAEADDDNGRSSSFSPSPSTRPGMLSALLLKILWNKGFFFFCFFTSSSLLLPKLALLSTPRSGVGGWLFGVDERGEGSGVEWEVLVLLLRSSSEAV